MANDAQGHELPGLIHKQTMSNSVEAQAKADNDNASSQNTAQAAPNFLDDVKPLEDTKTPEGISSADEPNLILYRVEYLSYDGKVIKNEILPSPYDSKPRPINKPVVLELITTVRQVSFDPSYWGENGLQENDELIRKSILLSPIRTGQKLEVHSEYVMNALRSLWVDENITHLGNTFQYPFSVLIFCMDNLKTYRHRNPDHHTEEYTRCSNKHLDLFIKFIDEFPDLKPVRDELARNAGKQPKFTHDYLWTIFHPGEFCYVREHDRLSGPFVIHHYAVGYEDPVANECIDTEVTVWNVNFDGTSIGRVIKKIRIEMCSGERLISTLKVILPDTARILAVVSRKNVSLLEASSTGN